MIWIKNRYLGLPFARRESPARHDGAQNFGTRTKREHDEGRNRQQKAKVKFST